MAVNEKNALKKELGRRLKEFRETLAKSREEMAAEIAVSEAVIRNIETGRINPQPNFLNYWQRQYGLDINWLLTGQGSMIIKVKSNEKAIYPLVDNLIKEIGGDLCGLLEMLRLLRVPLIRQLLLAKVSELKVFGKAEIDSFFAVKK